MQFPVLNSQSPEGKVLYQLVQPLAAGMDSLRETFAASLGKMEMGDLKHRHWPIDLALCFTQIHSAI